MDSKKIRKSFSRLAAWLGISICSLIVKVIPSGCLYAFAENIAKLAYVFARKHKNVALNSLRVAFGKEKSDRELEKIARNCFIYMAKSAVELMFFFDKPYALKDRAKLEGKENLDRALERGRGVILVSAHFGNFPLLLGRMAVEGYKVGGIMKPMHDARMEKIFFEKREKFGVKTIYSQPRNVCVNNTIGALRDNELIFIPIDQNFGTGGIFVDFFGEKAATATGPVILAQRTKAALIPCFIIRQQDDRHKIVFEKELELVEGQDHRDTVQVNIQNLTRIIESYIRKYPAEWGWIHRRWKSRPAHSK
ncbi:MAG: lysophospholipid acyltransferase family protein [Candidatus Omnitrophica bacterium]|jgi:KDO2-lipid IV(A) lauroyltransferase|nr:lysophospholipid acyltransferase family protein [Candidatus Omnitrophota bacterium]MDD5078030.1 lysophospholipid acyltransferase family protein [Candidatus Omnitrophota bacterium]MDD5725029.1 lysophospholipid acyltransferase family protein [Candidatus Omnitrophota bacterium]